MFPCLSMSASLLHQCCKRTDCIHAAGQASKSITGILKPLEILTRPQLPRAKPAAPGQASRAGAAASGPVSGQPSDAAAGSTGGAQSAGGQTAQQATATGVRFNMPVQLYVPTVSWH